MKEPTSTLSALTESTSTPRPKITGVFQVRIGGEVLTYSQVSQIPDSFDNLIRFEPDFPEPPHTLTDHAVMGQFPVVFAELMKRERGHASSHQNR